MATHSDITQQFTAAPPKLAEQKLDELIRLLQDEAVCGAELEQLKQRFHYSLNQLADKDSFNFSNHIADEQPLLVCGPNGKLVQRRRPAAATKMLPGTFRIIVSLLIITLGFAMIILPTPPSFEMYTLFYFNEQDGFTLMDLVSLVIVFGGIYALVTAMYRRQKAS